MARHEINFADSNGVWYTPDVFYGNKVGALEYVNERLHNKENKFYKCWVYNPDDSLIGYFTRGKKIEKLIKKIKDKSNGK